MTKIKKVPTLSEFKQNIKRPNYLGDPRTPQNMIDAWFKGVEDRYYKLYGQEKIESLRFRKEGE